MARLRPDRSGRSDVRYRRGLTTCAEHVSRFALLLYSGTQSFRTEMAPRSVRDGHRSGLNGDVT